MSEDAENILGGRVERDSEIAANLRELLVELAQWSRVAERNGDLHTRIAAALALDEERRELGRDASAAGEDGAAQ
jgi:hypothetical protein